MKLKKNLDKTDIGSDLQVFELPPFVYEILDIENSIPYFRTVTPYDFRL